MLVKRILNFRPFSISSTVYVNFSSRLNSLGVSVKGLSNPALISITLVEDLEGMPDYFAFFDVFIVKFPLLQYHIWPLDLLSRGRIATKGD
jgi:hypothetical protein